MWFGGDYYKLWSVNIKKYIFCVVLPILRSCKENGQNLLSFENIFEFSRSKMIRFWQLVLTLKCQGLAFSVHDPHFILIIQFGDRTSPFVRAVQLLAWNVSRLLVPQPKPRPGREETRRQLPFQAIQLLTQKSIENDKSWYKIVSISCFKFFRSFHCMTVM